MALRLSAASVLLLALVAAGCASQSGTTGENSGATAMTSSTGAAASGGTSAAASGGTKPAASASAKPAAASTTAATPEKPAATAAPAGDGKAVWDKLNCKMCHAVSAKGIAGGKKASDLSGEGGKRSAEWLRSWFKKETQLNGKTHPKAIKTDAEVDALVAFVRTF